jgi:hypothetical protein
MTPVLTLYLSLCDVTSDYGGQLVTVNGGQLVTVNTCQYDCQQLSI